MTFPDRRPPHHRPPHHWVIGDVHGCAEALQRLLVQLPAGDRLVFCGDVINRGSRIEESMELVWDLVRRQRAVWLKGNHERDLVRQLDTGLAPGRPDLNGNDTYRQLGAARCRLWRDRLDQLPLAYWGQGWVATHAGFDPRTWQPDLNVRLAFWQAYDDRFGEVIVGHTPGPGLRRVGSIVLLDTGACYGGDLTAYCPETRQTRQVSNGAAAGSPMAAPSPGSAMSRAL
ncbi:MULTISPECIES: metallophosphoesterase [unclassified Synechococcus]|uniref:metallophosphoesterase n=1 Tax=unclassified Synechococcus TaxID=2626047 RepID=UPI001C22628A|nr:MULTISPECIES: metallophosphoesterase [unclassified Synechococcus]